MGVYAWLEWMFVPIPETTYPFNLPDRDWSILIKASAIIKLASAIDYTVERLAEECMIPMDYFKN